MNSIVLEKNLLEQEMRDIYDKRESVAQWEAQISEIIKWFVYLCMCVDSCSSDIT